MKASRVGVALTVAVLALAGCTSGGPAAKPSLTGSGTAVDPPTSLGGPPSSPAAKSTSSPPARSAAQRAFDAMSERERVGQLLMVDCSTGGISAATATAITRDHVGSVILDGTTTQGMQAIQGLTTSLREIAPKDVGLFIATDQEGGEVQRLKGSSFSAIPSAVVQGGLGSATLRADAKQWGGELRRAGINVNLAPVFDTVPAGSGPNPPIGDLDREYGRTPGAVTRSALAVAKGETDAGIDVTAKHFPGLGRVAENTDTTSEVTDSVTTRHDPYLAPFRAAVDDHVPFVMMSTAIYSRIDPGRPAAFSKTIVTGMLRGDLGFKGVIISDDVGIATQVSSYAVGQRAVDFVAAGGDVVLTVDATQAGDMTAALLAETRTSAAFKKQVDAAALLVLQAKQSRGLLG